MKITPKKYEVVLFKKRNFASLGVVHNISGSVLEIINEEGKSLEIELDKIEYCSKIISDSSANKSEIKLYLRELRRDLEEKKQGLDLETIWECLYDPQTQKGLGLNEILDLYKSADSDSLADLLFVWAVQRDDTYFLKQDGLVYTNTPDNIQELIRKKEETEKRKLERKEALEWLKDINQGTVTPDKDSMQKYSTYLELIKGYAVYAGGYERIKEAKPLSIEIGLQDEIYALKFLIKAGLWDETQDPIFKRYGIKTTYPQKVQNEAEQLISKDMTYDRMLDITKLELISIDDETTKDIDDAISIEIMGENTRLGIHIANVAAVVENRSNLDKEALKRAETIYLSEGNVSMFPPELVEQLLSLNQKKVRKALSLFVTFDEQNHMTHYEFIQSKINVKRNISYSEANDEYLKTAEGKKLLDITTALRDERISRGAVILQLPTLKIKLDGDHVQSVSKYSMTTKSHNVIAECMILLNNLAGRYFAENKIPAIFRSQIENTSEEINSLDWDSELFPVQVIKYLRPTKISTEAETHRFLGIDAYVQISSPIRRYLDLVLQRQLVSCLEGTGPVYGYGALEKLYSQTEMGVKEKRLIEKSRERYWLLKYLSDNQIKELNGIVSVVRDRRINVYIPDYLLDLTLTPTNQSQLEVGSKVRVKITKIDLLRRKISACFAD